MKMQPSEEFKPTMESPSTIFRVQENKAAPPGPEKKVEDSGLQCFIAICRVHNIPADPGQLAHEYQSNVALRHGRIVTDWNTAYSPAMDGDLPDELLDPAVLGGFSEHLLDEETVTCTLCGRPLGFSTDDQPFWPTGPMCGDCYQAQQMDDEIAWSEGM